MRIKFNFEGSEIIITEITSRFFHSNITNITYRGISKAINHSKLTIRRNKMDNLQALKNAIKPEPDYMKIMGSSLIGYIMADYKDLVAYFGEPNSDGDGYKIDAHWTLRDLDGNIYTVYNYKDGKNYLGSAGCDVEDINIWHIGSHRKGNLWILGTIIDDFNLDIQILSENEMSNLS